MANLLLEQDSAELPIGSIINAVGPPDSDWHLCDGSILEKSNYPSYVANCGDLHPMRWSEFSFIDIGNPNSYIRRSISNIGDYVVMVGTNNLVNYSDDGGLTWSTTTLNSTNTHYSIANNGSNFVVAESGAAYAEYSTNYGASWTRVACTGSTLWNYVIWNGTYFIMTKAGSGNQLIARSTNGLSWTLIDLTATSQIPSGYCEQLETDDSGNLLMYVDLGSDYAFYRSTNHGTTWTTNAEALNPLCDIQEGDFFSGHAYAKGNWYAFPWNINYGWFAVSETGLTDWRMVPFPKLKTNQDLSYTGLFEVNDEAIMILGSVSYDNQIMVSPDGLHEWNSRVCPAPAYGRWNQTVCFGDDWMLIVGYDTLVAHELVSRAKYMSYDDTDYFQLPVMNKVTEAGNYKYIKMV